MKLTQKELAGKLNELESRYKTAKAEADRVPELQNELKQANDKIASLEKEAENQKEASAPAITEEDAQKTADLLAERGLLPEEQKQAFATSIVEDPSGLVDSIEKIASFATAAQMGEADGDAPLGGEELDPIAAFALG